MGSSHVGEVSLGNGKTGSSRKGKKSSNHNEKPKQPQRGLGVAQLEKIRLHNQLASYFPNPLHHHHHHHPFRGNMNKEDMSNATSSSVFSLQYPNNTMMGFEEVDQRLADIRYGEIQSSYTARPFLNHSNALLQQQAITLPLLEQNVEDSTEKTRRHDLRHSTSSTSQNSDSSETQGLDLDLKLSL